MRYICFDVETPNRYNRRMSSIGICAVEGERIIGEFYTLVDPEEPFDPFNIALTGIDPREAAKAPNFAGLWRRISRVMESGLLVAHNAQFDMSVLSKCLRDYGISAGSTKYLCTCRMSQRVMPDMCDHKLDTVCRELKIPLDHHNALSDARGCAKILIHMLKCGADPERFIRPYDLSTAKTLR